MTVKAYTKVTVVQTDQGGVKPNVKIKGSNRVPVRPDVKVLCPNCIRVVR